MNKIKINEGPELEVTAYPETVKIAENTLSWDLRRLPDGTYHILANGKAIMRYSKSWTAIQRP